MISRVMYDKLKFRHFYAPPRELGSIASILSGAGAATICTSDGDELSFGALGEVLFNGIPIGTVMRSHDDGPLLQVDMQGEVEGLEGAQSFRWRVRF